jgi:hypothetical protein
MTERNIAVLIAIFILFAVAIGLKVSGVWNCC